MRSNIWNRQGYISVINNSFKGLIISLIDYNYYKIRTRMQKMATRSNTLQLAQKTDGVLSNNEWVSRHLLDRDESEPDLYYAQLEPSLLSRPQATLPLTWSSLSAIRHYLVEKILSHLNSHMESLFLEKLSRLWKCQKKSWRERDWSEVKTMTCRDCVGFFENRERKTQPAMY